jgi:NADH-quinone oxidoreductase subunit M
MPILSVLVFLPLAGAILLIFIPSRKEGAIRLFTLSISIADFLLSLLLYFRFDAVSGLAQFVEDRAWIGAGIKYHVGADGISLVLILLTAFLIPVALLSSHRSIGGRVKEFSFFMLVLETGVLGVFVSLNIFLFYVFWEAMLIPMYFIIGIWGGARKVYATTKFVLVTMFGSLLMLAAILVLYVGFHRMTGIWSFEISDYRTLALGPTAETLLFLAFALAFAVKVPLFPLHTWLPDAHVEAPTPGSVILAGVLLKMGAYGFIRFALPIFPDAASRCGPWLSVLAVIGIIYGGFMALAQKDMKSLVAYSSVSHMGLVMLAVFSMNVEALEGAVFQMFNHGLSTGALFLCVGLLYERSHTRMIADYGGVSSKMPVFSALFLIAVLSSMGLPGLNGFAGEILCFFGIFAASKTLAVLSIATVILSAVYLLGLFRGVMHGPVVRETVSSLRDLDRREIAYLIPAIILMFGLGLAPGLLLGKLDATAKSQIALIKGRTEISRPIGISGPAAGRSPAEPFPRRDGTR